MDMINLSSWIIENSLKRLNFLSDQSCTLFFKLFSIVLIVLVKILRLIINYVIKVIYYMRFMLPKYCHKYLLGYFRNTFKIFKILYLIIKKITL